MSTHRAWDFYCRPTYHPGTGWILAKPLDGLERVIMATIPLLLQAYPTSLSLFPLFFSLLSNIIIFATSISLVLIDVGVSALKDAHKPKACFLCFVLPTCLWLAESAALHGLWCQQVQNVRYEPDDLKYSLTWAINYKNFLLKFYTYRAEQP